ncbi:O-antigen ligase family protein [Chitinasiproducens palmae]|uniref:O-antigen ligase n=1 Tax=Chitinasiproducens palmae TaxID=1770053 RepID=A0A1H2PSP8_9BURK|nr:O-antigen ligase family protein [Chitinasiproducens palmae]SDV50064.1 O-antigen ligase [Chitinasiproducens palmae]
MPMHDPLTTRSTGALASLACLVASLGVGTTLAVRGGNGYALFLLFALALYVGSRAGWTRGYLAPLVRYRWYTAAMCAPLCTVAVQQLLFGSFLPRQFDAWSRLVMILPIFLLLCRLPAQRLCWLGWGCVLGAICAGLWGGWQAWHNVLTPTNRLGNSYTNPIPFGNTALMFGFMSVLSIGWDRRPRLTAWPKTIALLAGLYASYLSGTRGGWLMIPLLILLLALQNGWLRHARRSLLLLAVVVALGAGLATTQGVRTRIDAAEHDVASLLQGQRDTSIGLRLQLWQASTRLFAQAPVFGVGKGHLERNLRAMSARHEVDQAIVNERAHSEFFSTLAEMGLIGVAMLALFYFGLGFHFWRELRNPDRVVRTAAFMGVAHAVAIAVFGLTIDVLVAVPAVGLVALFSATLLAIIESRRAAGVPMREPTAAHATATRAETGGSANG